MRQGERSDLCPADDWDGPAWRAARRRAGLRRVDVAFILDVAEWTLQRWELGRRTPPVDADAYLRLLQHWTPEMVAQLRSRSRALVADIAAGRPRAGHVAGEAA